MEPGTALSLYKTFMETYKHLSSDSEEDKVREAVVDSLKEFKFFYEDAEWQTLTDDDKYQYRMEKVSKEVRKIAVKADGVLDDEEVQKIRDLSAELEAFGNKHLRTSIGTHTGELMKAELEESYEKCDEIISDLES
jgi:hypothetical protein